MQFGDKLRYLLDEREISQKDFAAALRIAPTTLNGYVGNRREPDIELIKSMAFILNVSTDCLLDYNNGNAALSLKELSLISGFRKLDKKQQEIIYDLVAVSAKKAHSDSDKSAK